MTFSFKQVTTAHLDMIFRWLALPHVRAFWDNSQAHREDLINFTQGRKTQSAYADGKYVYWLALWQNEPFAMLMTIQETLEDDIGEEKLARLSQTGHTYSLDFMIGNTQYLGQGLAAPTLVEFLDFFRHQYDPKADTFLIDPECANQKAVHVYQQAGFEHVGDFVMQGDVSGAGKLHNLLVKTFDLAKSSAMPVNELKLVGSKLMCKSLEMTFAHDICETFTPTVTRWMWPSAPKTLEQITEHIRTKQAAMSRGEELAMVVLTNASEFIGYIAIHQLNTRTPELGIWLRETAQGKGYGFEALSLLIQWANETLTFDYLKYPVAKENTASRALIEKLGGEIATEYQKTSESGKILDEFEYRIFKPM